MCEIGLAVEQEEVSTASKADFLSHLVSKLLHHADAQLRQLDVDLRRELVADASGVETSRAESEHLARLENDDVGAAATRQVIGGARAHDSAADHDGLRGRLHLSFIGYGSTDGLGWVERRPIEEHHLRASA